MDGCLFERVDRFRQHRSRPRRPQILITPVSSTTTAFEKTSRRISGAHVRHVWLACCLFALLVHFFVMTRSYMNYETATETVIEMPTEVKPPATSVCFPLWVLTYQSKLGKGSRCFAHLLTNRSRVTDCATELLNRTLVSDVLFERTADPVDLIVSFWIRRASRNGTSWANKTTTTVRWNNTGLTSTERYLPGFVYSFYKGPYKCIRFNSVPLDSKTLSIDRMTTGYPRCMY